MSLSGLADISMHILLQGGIYALVVMGVYLSSRIIKFDDLTTEGSFGFGGAVTGLLLISGMGSWLTIPASLLSGSIAGLVTGLLHTRLKMNNLICGLVVTTALFSVCLKLAGGNLSLHGKETIFPHANPLNALALVGFIIGIAYLVLHLLFRSEIGLLLKALGTNPQMLTNLGKSVDGYKIFGLVAANSLTALAGSLFVQWNGFFSITGSVGTLVIGLTGLILSEMIRPRFGVALIVGAILTQAIFALTIALELEPLWNNLIKALLVVVLIKLKPSGQPIMSVR
jgi:putative ABC transport system permease protein